MIGRGHVQRMFSDAYDGTLSGDARARFEEHLRRCERCSGSYARYCESIGVLASLPVARMPRRVHIPADAALRSISSGQRRSSLRFVAPLSGFAVAAAVVAIAVISLHNVHLGGGAGGAASDGLQHGAAAGPLTAGCAVQLSPSVGLPQEGSAVSSRGPSTEARDAVVPTTELLLTSQTASAAPGSMFNVVASLVNTAATSAPGAAGGAPVCVSLTADIGGVTVPYAVPTAAGSSAASSSLPLRFDVPASVVPGSVLRVTVSAYTEGQVRPPVTAVLLIPVE